MARKGTFLKILARLNEDEIEDTKNMGGLINMPRYKISIKREVQNNYTSVALKMLRFRYQKRL